MKGLINNIYVKYNNKLKNVTNNSFLSYNPITFERNISFYFNIDMYNLRLDSQFKDTILILNRSDKKNGLLITKYI